MIEAVNNLLGVGLPTHAIDVGQMALRALVVYAVTLAIVRVGKKRFLGRVSAFDMIVGIVIGSTGSRAITGSAPMLPALAASATIVALHWLLSALAVHWTRFGEVIKGSPVLLIKDGEIDRTRLHREHMTDKDLQEDLRGKGLSGCEGVAEARLERDGRLSVLKQAGPSRVIEIRVADGVQTVRVEIG